MHVELATRPMRLGDYATFFPFLGKKDLPICEGQVQSAVNTLSIFSPVSQSSRRCGRPMVVASLYAYNHGFMGQAMCWSMEEVDLCYQHHGLLS